jgi:hypothetical protein
MKTLAYIFECDVLPGGGNAVPLIPGRLFLLLTCKIENAILPFGLRTASPDPRKFEGNRHAEKTVQIARECSIQAQKGAWDCSIRHGENVPYPHGSVSDNRNSHIRQDRARNERPNQHSPGTVPPFRPGGPRSISSPEPDSLPKIALRPNPPSRRPVSPNGQDKGERLRQS